MQISDLEQNLMVSFKDIQPAKEGDQNHASNSTKLILNLMFTIFPMKHSDLNQKYMPY
jgi:hypothetical protein